MNTHTHLPLPKFARRSALFLAVMELPLAFLSLFPVGAAWTKGIESGEWGLGLIAAYLVMGLFLYFYKWGMALGAVKGKQAVNLWAVNGGYVGLMLLALLIMVLASGGGGIGPSSLLSLYLMGALALSVRSINLIQEQIAQEDQILEKQKG